jgi:hypothetical protein
MVRATVCSTSDGMHFFIWRYGVSLRLRTSFLSKNARPDSLLQADGLLEHRLAVFGGWLLEEHVGTGVDEEADIRRVRRSPSALKCSCATERILRDSKQMKGGVYEQGREN